MKVQLVSESHWWEPTTGCPPSAGEIVRVDGAAYSVRDRVFHYWSNGAEPTVHVYLEALERAPGKTEEAEPKGTRR
jgi:hypothetical protein